MSTQLPWHTVAHMPILRISDVAINHPFGDDRTARQAFPQGISSKESDPFLMCDYFLWESAGINTNDVDYFPINWHPHRGMDIMTYMKTGIGRHGDSMGNRETFASPGIQWISVGSGIVHAEGGATPAGEVETGFQIWVNVPASKKMSDPAYGTEDPSSLPQVDLAPGVQARLLAGPFVDGRIGKFKTHQPVQIVDFEVMSGSQLSYSIPEGMDTCMVYVYEGSGSIAGQAIFEHQIALLDASSTDKKRLFDLATGDSSLSAMLFAGKKLHEPIAWHGPVVMNTRQQLTDTFEEIRNGKFPPKRVLWDYTRMDAYP
jgi:redox-sensitive bicupin YhaK (pirin superfamily)